MTENKINFMKNITLANSLRVNKLARPGPRRDNERSVTVNERSPQTRRDAPLPHSLVCYHIVWNSDCPCPSEILSALRQLFNYHLRTQIMWSIIFFKQSLPMSVSASSLKLQVKTKIFTIHFTLYIYTIP